MWKKCAGVFALVGLAMAAATVASAQEKGQVGLNLGYPSVGLTWHVSDRVAVRPEFNFSFGSSSSTSGSGFEGSDSDAWGVGFGVSALFYVGEWDTVQGYVVPRLSFLLSETDRIGTTSESTSENSTSGWDAGVMVGAEYPLNRRLSVFGEVGFTYVNRHAETRPLSTLILESDSWSFGPRTAIGMIVYF
ncbi:MAG: hypothetical protein EHM24_13565 [Acidobacteria bacterium]|nr:MAG: hypothetical protein EHM24_13565 [Acidobacteriota bacterium]